MNMQHNPSQETGQRIHDLWSAALDIRARHKCWTATSSTPSGSSSLGLPSTASTIWIWIAHDMIRSIFWGKNAHDYWTRNNPPTHPYTAGHMPSNEVQNPFHFTRLPLSCLDAQLNGLTLTISKQKGFAFFSWPRNAKKRSHVLYNCRGMCIYIYTYNHIYNIYKEPQAFKHVTTCHNMSQQLILSHTSPSPEGSLLQVASRPQKDHCLTPYLSANHLQWPDFPRCAARAYAPRRSHGVRVAPHGAPPLHRSRPGCSGWAWSGAGRQDDCSIQGTMSESK